MQTTSTWSSDWDLLGRSQPILIDLAGWHPMEHAGPQRTEDAENCPMDFFVRVVLKGVQWEQLSIPVGIFANFHAFGVFLDIFGFNLRIDII